MTFSILALDKETGAIGCAAATGNLAVGGWVLRASARAGAVATQGLSVSALWGDDGLERLTNRESAEEVVAHVTRPDTGRDHRQFAVLDLNGQAAVWTGDRNVEEKGHVIGPGFVVAGNWLSSLDVLEAMQRTHEDRAPDQGSDFGRHLLTCLEAGVAAGSDARGTLSAAIRIVRRDCAPLDLRVDFDDDPVARLIAVYDLATGTPYNDWATRVPTLDEPYRY